MAENAKAGLGFDPVGLARVLLRTARSGALGTLVATAGGPFSSLVSVATDADGSPLILVSRLAGHTTNLDADGRASLLLARTGRGDPLAHPRLTLVGHVSPVEAPDDLARVRRRFLARHPKAKLYADFPDFGFRRMTIERAHLNGGFARAATLGPEDVLTDLSGAEALIEAEEGAVAHLNADHADAVALYATVLAGTPGARWRISGLDPDGLDLAAGDRTARLAFPERVTGPGALRGLLVLLAKQARDRANDGARPTA